MSYSIGRFSSSLSAGLAMIALPVVGMAAISFIGTGGVQQNFDHPCIIGDPSCSNGGFVYTSDSGQPEGHLGTYDLYSPVYLATLPFTTYDTNLIPTTFSIGIDQNLATGAGLEVLQAFNTYSCTSLLVSSCTTLVGSNSYNGPTPIPDNANGTGFSDAMLTGFQLQPDTLYRFEAIVSNDTDGMEEFFLIRASAIPEPKHVVLLAAGALALFLTDYRRRRRNKLA